MKHPLLLSIALVCLLGVVCLLAFLFGVTTLSFADLGNPAYAPILKLRLLRIAAGLLAGAGLGVCGVAMQAILRNPLADPYLLSTSSGAGMGIVLILFLGIPAVFLPGAAFAGALVSTFLVYLLAQKDGKISAIQLILSGVIISIAISGLTIFLASISTNPAVPGMLWWLLGSLQTVDPVLLMIVAAMVLGGSGLLWFFAQDLNAITLGEEAALHLGVEVETLKRIVLVLITLITGAVVALSGVIGFVGLIVPHAIRRLTGPNHKLLLPISALAAGGFLVTCDLLGRIVMPPIEIPIGVITALVGAPVFLGLLKWKV